MTNQSRSGHGPPDPALSVIMSERSGGATTDPADRVTLTQPA